MNSDHRMKIGNMSIKVLLLVLIISLANVSSVFAQEVPPEVGNSQVLEAKGAPLKEGWNYFTLGFSDCTAENVLNELQADAGSAVKVDTIYTKELFNWSPYSFLNNDSKTKKIGDKQIIAFNSRQNFYFEMDQKSCLLPNPQRDAQIKEVREGKTTESSFVEKVRDLPADLWTRLTDLLNKSEAEQTTTSLPNQNFENLTIGGKTTVNDLGITGKVSAGLLSIDGLQSSIGSLADIKFKLPGGEVTIDKDGNLKTNGTLSAKKIQLDQSDNTSKSAGTVVIKAGLTQTTATTNLMTANSLIFATPDKAVAVGARRQDNTTILITIKEPLSEDLKVNWWIIN